MDLGWVAIAVNDVAWLSLAFVLGFLSRSLGLPPLVGFLVAGFIINTQDSINSELFQKLADLGITLLLFTIGLKINFKLLIKPHIWILTGTHLSIIIILFGALFYTLGLIGVFSFSGLNFSSALIIAFALSFSSTVFVVKVLEDNGELKSFHGNIAIGILIIQDIAAVIFLALSTNKLPTLWVISLLLLFPMKYIFTFFLNRVGHGELMVLFGFILAMGGAEFFELVGMKGDLGALVIGMIIASHPKTDDLAKSMMGFKDLFLLGFFVSIGLSGHITTEILIIALLITPLIFIKSILYFSLLLSFKLRARTSLLTSINLTNYSEFGLIVAAIASGNNWIANDWLIIIAVAMSFSFIISAILNSKSNTIYSKNKNYFKLFQRADRLVNDYVYDIKDAKIMIVGMGTFGLGSFDMMEKNFPNLVIGVDIDRKIIEGLKKSHRLVIQGDPSDADFWDRIQQQHSIDLIMLALPKLKTTLAVIEQLKEANYHGKIAAATKYHDDLLKLKDEGIMTVANIFNDAGAGFANHVTKKYKRTQSP
jgi:predicted Kef-type K+ transport protein